MQCIPNTSHPHAQLLLASHLPATARQAQLWAPCRWNHICMITPLCLPFGLLLHLPLIPPAKRLHPVTPVCGDCIFFPSFWNKLRTVLCSFPALWPSCKKPVGCCNCSRTVNISFIMEGVICVAKVRETSSSRERSAYFLSLIAVGFCRCLHRWVSFPPTHTFFLSPLTFFPLLCWCIGVSWSFSTKQADRSNRILPLQPQSAKITH